MIKHFINLIIIASIGLLCSNSSEIQYIDYLPAVNSPIPTPIKDVCGEKANYIPDFFHPDHTPMRYVRVNFHFINSADGKNNFNKKEGKRFIKIMMETANYRLANNSKMHLPLSNRTPALPTRIQYVLTPSDPSTPNDDGIYFHTNEEVAFFNKKKGGKNNTFVSDQYDQYGLKKEEVLNIFMLEHYPDSIKSKTYKASTDGVGKPFWGKLAGAYHRAKVLEKGQPDPIRSAANFYSAYLNHEIGHSLSLHHTWNTSDGCDDTPKNKNCWNFGRPPCDEEVSNNVMDYNAQMSAYSPCQIGRMHAKFIKENSSQRKILEPVWCDYNSSESVTINRGEKVVWNTAKDLTGDIIINKGAELRIHCQVSLPAKAMIKVNPGGRLIIDGGLVTNFCGDQWNGIKIGESRNKKGEVEMINGGFVDKVKIMKR